MSINCIVIYGWVKECLIDVELLERDLNYYQFEEKSIKKCVCKFAIC